MKKYLSTLKDKPHHHKQRFALLVSGIFTLIVFSFWSFVVFRGPSDVQIVTGQTKNEPGPLSSLHSNTASAFQAIKNDFESLKNLLNTYAQ